jgi:hypothetical protein
LFALPNLTATIGNNLLKFTLSSPNNGIDGNSKNDTISTVIKVAPPIALPYNESFESATFPPENGTIIINPDAGQTWVRVTGTGRPGTGAIGIDCFNYGPNKNGQRDIYRLPPINARLIDSVTLSFNVAYRQYFGSDVATPSKDSLRVVYSGDCGNTWLPTGYAKGGASLSSVAGTTGRLFSPANAGEWRTENIVIKDLCSQNIENLVIGLEAINNYGNAIYIDSISITGFNSSSINTILRKIREPLFAECKKTLAPVVTFGNDGLDTIRTLKVNYVIDNSTDTIVYNWAGRIGKCDSITASLAPFTSTVGTHTIKVFTSLPNGGIDKSLQNDTLQKTFSIYESAATPVSEDFEEETQYPRNNWGVQNVNGGTTWQRSTEGAQSGKGALWINNPNTSNKNNAVDYFISPIVLNSQSYDSLLADFDLAYQPGPRYPGSTTFPLDTLELLVTTDCGASFTSVWKKWGAALQTVDDPNYTYTKPFVPQVKEEWKKQYVYLSPLVGAENFQLYFIAKGNKQNNIWIDNVNITSKTLPQKLKNQGYLVYPNPFNSIFLIHHYAAEPPVSLQSVQVFNSSGQRVWTKSYNGNADRQITVDLKGSAKGLYVLKMIYTNKTIVEKIIKH